MQIFKDGGTYQLGQEPEIPEDALKDNIAPSWIINLDWSVCRAEQRTSSHRYHCGKKERKGIDYVTVIHRNSGWRLTAVHFHRHLPLSQRDDIYTGTSRDSEIVRMLAAGHF